MRGDGALGALELDLMCDKKILSKDTGFLNICVDGLSPLMPQQCLTGSLAQTSSTLLSNQVALLFSDPVFSCCYQCYLCR